MINDYQTNSVHKLHDRCAFRSIEERQPFLWPDGKRLAVYIALNIESYSFGSGLIEELVPVSPQPDVLNYSWCDYGNRVGVWRLLEIFNSLNLPITLLVNSAVYSTAPSVIEPFRQRGDEISCHGRTNSERQAGLSKDEERKLIREATETISLQEGCAPKGWLGPWISETFATPDLLKESGYDYLLDWAHDDQPVWLSTTAGPLLSVPYPQELNDSSSCVGRFVGAAEFADMVIDQFDEMLEQSEKQSLVMGLALHAHISGQPFRLRHLRRALQHIADNASKYWLTRAGDIASHFSEQVGQPK
jgi:allantoinase